MDKKELFEYLGLSEYIAFDLETTGKLKQFFLSFYPQPPALPGP